MFLRGDGPLRKAAPKKPCDSGDRVETEKEFPFIIWRMDNKQIARILRETAQLLEIDGAIIGRYRSYEKAA